MRYIARSGDHHYTIALPGDGQGQRVALDGQEFDVAWNAIGETLAALSATGAGAAHYGLLVGTRSHDIYVRPIAGDEEQEAAGAQTFEVSLDGRTFVITLQDERTQALASLASEGHIAGEVTIRAPMPGLVSNVLVEAGAAVQRGQTIVVLEAMKMENDLTTPRPGVVTSVRVAKGQTVNQGDVLAVVGDPAGAAPPDAEEL
ncbi:MAG TPA: acetyl-CoA carboxylase biotin carboxyl carrier protein subunit [Ktedonobacterales bacterium]